MPLSVEGGLLGEKASVGQNFTKIDTTAKRREFLLL